MPKFKNIKKSDKEEQKKKSIRHKKKDSPKITRLITEKTAVKIKLPQFHKQFSWILWGILGIILSLEALGMYFQVRELRFIQNQRLEVQSAIASWGEFMITHAGYRDGYMHIAMLYYQLGDTNNAMKYVEKVLSIDPNYLPALKLKGILLTAN